MSILCVKIKIYCDYISLVIVNIKHNFFVLLKNNKNIKKYFIEYGWILDEDIKSDKEFFELSQLKESDIFYLYSLREVHFSSFSFIKNVSVTDLKNKISIPIQNTAIFMATALTHLLMYIVELDNKQGLRMISISVYFQYLIEQIKDMYKK